MLANIINKTLTWMWWPESGSGYAFFSSVGGDTAILAGFFAIYRAKNCSAPWCLRIGKHPTADGLHHMCRHHHPDLPKHRMTLGEIHIMHKQHKEQNN